MVVFDVFGVEYFYLAYDDDVYLIKAQLIDYSERVMDLCRQQIVLLSYLNFEVLDEHYLLYKQSSKESHFYGFWD